MNESLSMVRRRERSTTACHVIYTNAVETKTSVHMCLSEIERSAAELGENPMNESARRQRVVLSPRRAPRTRGIPPARYHSPEVSAEVS